MTIQVTTITQSDDENKRWEIIKATEGTGRVDPYIDSPLANILTMEAGFNVEIRDNLKTVLTSFGVTFSTKKDDDLLFDMFKVITNRKSSPSQSLQQTKDALAALWGEHQIKLKYTALTLLFIGIGLYSSLIIANDNVDKYTIEKGQNYELCNAFAEYVYPFSLENIRSSRDVIQKAKLKLSLPKSKKSSAEKYVQLSLQAIGASELSLTGYNGWTKSIDIIEKVLQPKSKLRVRTLSLDVNNDGQDENVLTFSAFIPEIGWYHGNYILDEDGFLNVKFDKNFSFSGRLFYFDGRTFSYTKNTNSISIAEHFPTNESFITSQSKGIGIHIRYGVCKIRFDQ